jgi:hypothetical protein
MTEEQEPNIIDLETDDDEYGSGLQYSDSPDWRWQRALYEHRKESTAGYYTPSSDMCVCQLVDYLNFWKCDVLSEEDKRRIYPEEYSLLVDIYKNNTAYSTRHALEACIIGSANAKFIKKHVHNKLSPTSIHMYKKYFFDLSKNTADLWVEQHIINPYRGFKDDAWTTGFFWKVVSKLLGPELMIKLCVNTSACEPEDFKELRKLTAGAEMGEVLKQVLKSDKLPREIIAPGLATAAADCLKDFAPSNEVSNALANPKKDWEEVVGMFSSYTKMYADNEVLPKEERFDDIDKYTEKDLTDD